jgi:hypothetical protein
MSDPEILNWITNIQMSGNASSAPLSGPSPAVAAASSRYPIANQAAEYYRVVCFLIDLLQVIHTIYRKLALVYPRELMS